MRDTPANLRNLLIRSQAQRRRALRVLGVLRGAAAAVRAFPVDCYGSGLLRDRAAAAIELEAADVHRALEMAKSMAALPGAARVSPPWLRPAAPDMETDT